MSEVGLSFTIKDVMAFLQYLFAVRGTPAHLRNDTGLQFILKLICCGLQEADVKKLFFGTGIYSANDYLESLNGTLRNELLNRLIFLRVEDT